MLKSAARRAGLDPKTLPTHTLRKSFRKILNALDIDEDTKEALIGHSLSGSRGNYFDFQDIDDIAQKYMRANFSKEFDIQEVQTAVKRTRELEEDIQRRDTAIQKRDRMIRDLKERFEQATKRLEDLERKLKERA